MRNKKGLNLLSKRQSTLLRNVKTGVFIETSRSLDFNYLLISFEYFEFNIEVIQITSRCPR